MVLSQRRNSQKLDPTINSDFTVSQTSQIIHCSNLKPRNVDQSSSHPLMRATNNESIELHGYIRRYSVPGPNQCRPVQTVNVYPLVTALHHLTTLLYNSEQSVLSICSAMCHISLFIISTNVKYNL